MEKTFLNIDGQIKLLKKRGMLFRDDDEIATYNALEEFGYYEIVNGYRDPFIYKDSDQFLPNTSFYDVFRLFLFDQNLRDDVMSAIEMFELTFRQSVARIFGEKYGHLQKEYLSVKNFQSDQQLRRLIPKFADLAFTDNSQPYAHYRSTYENIPPWVVVKGLEFSMLKTWYNALENDLKLKVLQEMIDPVVLDALVSKPTKKRPNPNQDLLDLFGSALQIIHQIRNRAAHGGRIYNYFPTSFSGKPLIKYTEKFHKAIKISPAQFRTGKGTSGVWLMLKFFQMLKHKRAYNALDEQLTAHLINYLIDSFESFEQFQEIIDAMRIPTNHLAWTARITAAKVIWGEDFTVDSTPTHIEKKLYTVHSDLLNLAQTDLDKFFNTDM